MFPLYRCQVNLALAQSKPTLRAGNFKVKSTDLSELVFKTE